MGGWIPAAPPDCGYHTPVEEPFLSRRQLDDPMRIKTARQLLRDQDGEIRLQSSAWYGTAVVLLLPYAIGPNLERQ